jgi:hypothetical protein
MLTEAGVQMNELEPEWISLKTVLHQEKLVFS